jgi:hypothetical protein
MDEDKVLSIQIPEMRLGLQSFGVHQYALLGPDLHQVAALVLLLQLHVDNLNLNGAKLIFLTVAASAN